MIINATQNSLVGKSNPLASGLSIKSISSAPAVQSDSEPKNSVYSNFEKEMSRRLNEAAKSHGSHDKSADSSVLLQSLTGAMGEIGEMFGREAATEVMANILTGTAKGITEESLMSSIQNSLAGLSRLDPNKTKVAKLSESFNKDLSLALDQELADKKLESKQTFSLSYALSKHFSLLSAPVQEETEEANPADSAEKGHKAQGFNAAGKWDTVAVTAPDEAAAEEIRAAAEAGLNKAADVTVAAIMKQENGSGLFEKLSGFLEKNFQDKAASLFVDECVMNATVGPEGASPKMAEMLSQVYSKVAADGDADKLAVLENYINTDFKNALNPVLGAMQQSDVPGMEDLGAVQFKGISGASLAGESDAFSFNWGYEKDNSYDRSVSKRFLQEDIRAVKAAKENAERAEEDRLAKAWDDTAEEKRIKEAAKPDEPLPGAENIQTTLGEKFAAERRQEKLEEAMSTKFGQLSDSSREDLEQYIKDNFSEEEAEKLLEDTKWNNDLMSGLAALHRDIREFGADESKAKGFINFLNSTLKQEVDSITEKLGGLAFEGWQAMDGASGELEANFKFNGQDTTKVIVMGLEKTLDTEKDAQKTHTPSPRLLDLGTGYLIDLMA